MLFRMASMKRVLGQQPKKTEHHLREIIFPQLAMIDTMTGDDRLIVGDGFDVRSLPRTIYAQYVQSYGHDGAEVAGSLHEVTIDPDSKVVSGRGWIMVGPEGEKLVRHLAANALRHNSIDLAEIKAEIRWKSDDPSDPDFWEYEIIFHESKLGATTLVGMPAFPNAEAELGNEDLAAALISDEPLVVDVPTVVTFDAPKRDLVANAAAAIVQPWDDFHIPEAQVPHKVTIDEAGRVFGHLAKWDSCWGDEDGLVARCIMPPRPTDGYASYHQPFVLTDRGRVDTGPLFLVGGHPEVGPTDEDFNQAYGGVENTVADVRVIPGRFGPWVSGRVRPGATPEQIYAARASRYSGHWRRGRLRAAVGVNVAAFDVGGSGRDLVASFTLDENGEVLDLIAGFQCDDAITEIETEQVETPPLAVDDVEELEIAALETAVASIGN